MEELMATPTVQSRRTQEQPCTAPRPQGSVLRSSTFVMFLPALATSLLLWLSYFPVNAGWLGWVALVPLLTLVRSEARPRRIYLAAYLGGLAFFWPAIQWMRVADPRMYGTWAMLATYCAVYFPAAVFLLRKLDRGTRLPLSVTLPVVWTALELLRAHLMTGFPWYFLGHAQHDVLPIIQISDLTGAYGVTFLVAAVNGLFFELLAARSWPSDSRVSLRMQAFAVVLLVAAGLGYGFWRLGQSNFADGPKIALIQGNLDQRIRNAASTSEGALAAGRAMVKHYGDLSTEALAQKPDLIVWPETSFPGEWVESADGRPSDDSMALAEYAHRKWPTHVLLGLNARVGEKPARRYNSALLLYDANPVGRYDKIHRVPFGEYVPLRDWLPWMDLLSPYDFDYSIRSGDLFTRFPLGKWNFGALICYEDTDPALARRYVDAEETGRVDFLLNISNDGWFDGTSEHDEHLAICRFRAVECRRAVARAVNMGISAVIDGNGRVIALPAADWKSSKKVEAVLTATVPIDARTSRYAAWGDWLPWGCWIGIAAGLLIGRLRLGVGD